ncbi:epoxide hydrolase 1 [Anopheles sinensis]|uniref:Epoxide hydrolase 1 n=1 Tax=Anopheles sinensis TaxID=74873 RepID=A0A084WQC0_ANOSI|nr:epoxide hydrolase 1 [Anopheles sinensis]
MGNCEKLIMRLFNQRLPPGGWFGVFAKPKKLTRDGQDWRKVLRLFKYFASACTQTAVPKANRSPH